MSLTAPQPFATYSGITQTFCFTAREKEISATVWDRVTSQSLAVIKNIPQSEERILWFLKNGYSLRLDKSQHLSFVPGLLGGGKTVVDTIKSTLELAEALRTTDPQSADFKQLLGLAHNVIQSYANRTVKTASLLQELTLLAGAKDKQLSREVLKAVYTELHSAPLLDIDLLTALRDTLRATPPSDLDPDDLVNILKTLNTKYESFHAQKTTFSKLYDLLYVLSGTLDVMGDANVEKLSYDHLHDPLYRSLNDLTKHEDWRIVTQAAYGKESLLRIGHDKSKLIIFLGRALNVALGISGAGQLFLNKDLAAFVDGCRSFKEALHSQGKPQSWYNEIRILGILSANNQFEAFSKHVQELDPKEIPSKEHAYLLSGVFVLLIDVVIHHSDGPIRVSALKLLIDLIQNKDWKLRKKSKDLRTKIRDGIRAQVEAWTNEKDTTLASTAEDSLKVLKATSRPGSSVVTRKPFVRRSSLLLDQAKSTPKSLPYLIHELQHHYLSDPKIETLLATYIAPQGSYSRAYDNPSPLQEEVMKFLASNRKVLLIQGDSGAGKTTFGHFLAHHLWKNWKKGDPICLFIPPVTTINSRKPIEDTLKSHGFSDDQILRMKKEKRFLFIFDGYDEIGKRVNLYHQNQLDDWNAKMMVSCRTQYLHGSDDPLFAPLSDNVARTQLLSELWITPFTDKEINAYLKQYLAQAESPVWTRWQQYREHIDQIIGLKQLISVPFLLYVTAEVLPDIVKKHEKEQPDKQLKLLRLDLYDAFVTKWFHRSEVRLRRAGELADFEGDIKRSFLGYCKALAAKMCAEETTIVTYLPPAWGEDESPWEEFFGKEDSLVPTLRDGSPLQKVGKNSYCFFHKSILEYFIYRADADKMQKLADSKGKEPKKEKIGSFI